MQLASVCFKAGPIESSEESVEGAGSFRASMESEEIRGQSSFSIIIARHDTISNSSAEFSPRYEMHTT